MLIKYLVRIEHTLDAKEDSVVVVDEQHLAVFFKWKPRYVLYNYVKMRVEREIPTMPLHSVTLWRDTSALAMHSSSQLITVVDLLEGTVVDQHHFQGRNQLSIPEVIVISNQAFGIVESTGGMREMTIFDQKLKMRRFEWCEEVIEKFAEDSLVSYNQWKQTLSFMIIKEEKTDRFQFPNYSITNILVIRILSKSHNEVLLFSTNNGKTCVEALNLETLQRLQLLSFEEQMVDLLMFNSQKEMYIFFTWFLHKENPYEILIYKSKSQVSASRIPLANGRGTYSKGRFCTYGIGQSKEASFLELFALRGRRNLIINLMVRSGVGKLFGSEIVGKVLTVIDY